MLTPRVVNEHSIRLLQLTDMHLFRDKHQSLLGVNTWQSYQSVLGAVAAEKQFIDLIIATGDLAQDHSPEAYLYFAEGIQSLSATCVWLPGNHDFQPAMVQTLADTGIRSEKHILLGQHWQVLLLDSQVCGAPHGMLSDHQLKWLDTALAARPERHSLILLHHHPVPSDCTWLDQHGLRNAWQLAEVLAPYPLASTLVCGHIHQEMDVKWHQRRVLATPSTCVQFRPQCTSFTMDTLAPGWRWIELRPHGQLITEIKRLNSTQFRPDFNSEGY